MRASCQSSWQKHRPRPGAQVLGNGTSSCVCLQPLQILTVAKHVGNVVMGMEASLQRESLAKERERTKALLRQVWLSEWPLLQAAQTRA